MGQGACANSSIISVISYGLYNLGEMWRVANIGSLVAVARERAPSKLRLLFERSSTPRKGQLQSLIPLIPLSFRFRAERIGQRPSARALTPADPILLVDRIRVDSRGQLPLAIATALSYLRQLQDRFSTLRLSQLVQVQSQSASLE